MSNCVFKVRNFEPGEVLQTDSVPIPASICRIVAEMAMDAVDPASRPMVCLINVKCTVNVEYASPYPLNLSRVVDAKEATQ